MTARTARRRLIRPGGVVGFGLVILLSAACGRALPARSPAVATPDAAGSVAATRPATRPASRPTAPLDPDGVATAVRAWLEGLESVRGDARRIERERVQALGAAAIDPLLAAIDDPRMTVRWNVVNMLGAFGDPRVLSSLIERVVLDPSSHVRWRTIWALSALDVDALVVEQLSQHLADPRTRWRAAVALGQFGEQSVIPILGDGLDDPDALVRFEAAFGLGRTFDATTSAVLDAGLAHGDPRTRREIVMSLGRIGDPTAVAALRRALRDPAPAVRWRAASGLARAGAVSGLADIGEALERESDDDARARMRTAFESLRTRTESPE